MDENGNGQRKDEEWSVIYDTLVFQELLFLCTLQL